MIDIKAIIKEGESQTLEFKCSFQKEVIETIVAFANAKGGKVLIGVSESGKIVGVKLQKESVQGWINQIKLSTSVIPDVHIEKMADKNMIVHRDHRDSSDSVIKIYDERIEFFNPGGLYDDLTIEQLKSNNYKSKTRNKLLAMMYKECGFIEKYGSGIGRIKKFCKEHKIEESKFEELQKGFQVTLYKKVVTPQKTPRVKILDLMRDNKHITIASISAALNIGKDTINEHIAKLKKEDKLKREGVEKMDTGR